MEIRAEKPEDIETVRRVNTAAFGRSSEAHLVDRLRNTPSTLSLVAVSLDQIVGHLFFSPVTIDNCSLFMLGLAPVAVLPNYQRQGIGSLLIQQGLKECDRQGCKAVVVLGSPEYYSRFRFITAKTKGLKCEYTVPDEAFMVLELESGTLDGCSGIVKYRSEFNDLE
ncbi:GNAT family N-acetyltransferase [Leptolyngbya sp. AN03gr2]|uniref:GNAT family N-acetyltransferase n=1 Tax=unclassified Leptolyngbya TaxID=2650499 RepID=UPI003D31280B